MIPNGLGSARVSRAGVGVPPTPAKSSAGRRGPPARRRRSQGNISRSNSALTSVSVTPARPHRFGSSFESTFGSKGEACPLGSPPPLVQNKILNHLAFALILPLAICESGAQPAPSTPSPTTTSKSSPAPPAAGDALPETAVWVARLDLAAGTVAAPRRLTESKGYNNQPAFVTDGSALFFVSDRTGAIQIYRHELASGETTQLTSDPGNKFSPMPLPDGRGFSAVRVIAPEAGSGVESKNPPVWRYSAEGKPIGPVIDVRRVGYYAWLGAEHLALFLVIDGEKDLSELVQADIASGKTALLSKSPGRSFARTPDGARVAFVDKSEPKRWKIVAMKPGDERPQFIVDTPVGATGEKDGDRSEDWCWLPGGSILMANGGKFLRWDGKPGGRFQVLTDLGDLGGNIRRLAVSRDGRHVAFVVQRPQK
ncbi:MAG: hypothetical protein EXS37_07190 [Opitutus sp.]|nr:hypothetical protein [Opitutus sp.]